MSFSIPKKAWHSFSRKQVIDSLIRIAAQIEQGWHKAEYRQNELSLLQSYVENLKEHHPSHKIQLMAQQVLDSFELPQCTQRQIQEFQMTLERCDERDVKDEDFLISTEDTREKKQAGQLPLILVLDNLRSSFNVGSLFRTAESLGVKHIHLCGYTPTPENSKTARSSLGTENWIEWSYWESTFECLEHIKRQGHTLYALETEHNAIELSGLRPQFPAALILGNERYGLSEEVLKQVEQTIKIKMAGRKNSLNVAVCGAIAIHHLSLRTAVSI